MSLQLSMLSVQNPPALTRSPKQPKNQQDIRAKWTRDEREQEEHAFWSGLSCRIPPQGVPSLWTCFGERGRLMCSWCGWSFDRATGTVKQTGDTPAHGCPRCPVEHPELRPSRVVDDDDQLVLWTG